MDLLFSFLSPSRSVFRFDDLTVPYLLADGRTDVLVIRASASSRSFIAADDADS